MHGYSIAAKRYALYLRRGGVRVSLAKSAEPDFVCDYRGWWNGSGNTTIVVPPMVKKIVEMEESEGSTRMRQSMREVDIEIILEGAKEKYPEAKRRIISDNEPQFITLFDTAFDLVMPLTIYQ